MKKDRISFENVKCNKGQNERISHRVLHSVGFL